MVLKFFQKSKVLEVSFFAVKALDPNGFNLIPHMLVCDNHKNVRNFLNSKNGACIKFANFLQKICIK